MENVLYLGYKNDVAFLLEQVLFLGEHQSSWNPNMPLRGLLYFSSMYQDYVTGKNRKLMESCRPLHDYSLFVHRIREKLAEGYRPDDRMEDFWKAVEDEKLCRRLLEEYGINTTL